MTVDLAKLAVPYVRTSTDDKGQDPMRQMIPIEAWAQREGFTLLRPVVDEGTSASKVSPLDRPKFREACETAKRVGALVVVETPDRLTREGADMLGYTRVCAKKEYGVQILFTDVPLGTFGDAMGAWKAGGARDWVEEHSNKVRTGMVKAKLEGRRVGGAQPKPLTPEEMDLAIKLRLTPGRGGHPTGWPTIAKEISRRRGALEIANVAARRKRAVTANHVQDLAEAEMRARGITPPATPWSKARTMENAHNAAGVLGDA